MSLLGVIFVLFLISVDFTKSWMQFQSGLFFDESSDNTMELNAEADLSVLEEMWFEQKLDHFDPFNSVTWNQVDY